MGRKFSFSIPGRPRGKARPRFARNGRTYTPAETVAAEREIAQIWKLKFPREAPLTAEAYNVGTGVETRLDALAPLLLDALGSDAQVSFSGERRAGDPANWRADTSRIAALGFDPTVRIEEGAARYATIPVGASWPEEEEAIRRLERAVLDEWKAADRSGERYFPIPRLLAAFSASKTTPDGSWPA